MRPLVTWGAMTTLIPLIAVLRSALIGHSTHPRLIGVPFHHTGPGRLYGSRHSSGLDGKRVVLPDCDGVRSGGADPMEWLHTSAWSNSSSEIGRLPVTKFLNTARRRPKDWSGRTAFAHLCGRAGHWCSRGTCWWLRLCCRGDPRCSAATIDLRHSAYLPIVHSAQRQHAAAFVHIQVWDHEWTWNSKAAQRVCLLVNDYVASRSMWNLTRRDNAQLEQSGSEPGTV
jgi:hypothetical protein